MVFLMSPDVKLLPHSRKSVTRRIEKKEAISLCVGLFIRTDDKWYPITSKLPKARLEQLSGNVGFPWTNFVRCYKSRTHTWQGPARDR
uniref:Uncharacterized protein n=1 Tax=Candidatus Kentrum sp. LFY TaxID=2126342 RepID=A0A450W9S9_9GAMM|nr:MAG: hypothetical protein BECKLFY1418C_GA0070996_100461 [Candidatus Kentron sp. LFY]